MKSILTLVAALALSGAAIAGPVSMKAPKAPVMPPPPPTGCDCFAPGLAYGIFGGGYINDDNALGGGVLMEYAFNPYVALQGSYGVYATSPEHHSMDGNLILRYPIDSICIAPYVLVGGGYSTNSVSGGHIQAGGGIEARFPSLNCMGLFADGVYYWAEDEVEDHTIVRVGVKFPF